MPWVEDLGHFIFPGPAPMPDKGYCVTFLAYVCTGMLMKRY
jgi:hypothetical protein